MHRHFQLDDLPISANNTAIHFLLSSFMEVCSTGAASANFMENQKSLLSHQKVEEYLERSNLIQNDSADMTENRLL